MFFGRLSICFLYTLDGGRLLSIVLEGFFGVRGIKIAYFLSILIAAAVGLIFFALGAVLAGSLFLILASKAIVLGKAVLLCVTKIRMRRPKCC